VGIRNFADVSNCVDEPCYHTVCSLGKSQLKQQVFDTIGDTYHCHLNKYPPCFSNGQVQHKGGFPGDPRGVVRERSRAEGTTPTSHDLMILRLDGG
jgi:hypothetical protein